MKSLVVLIVTVVFCQTAFGITGYHNMDYIDPIEQPYNPYHKEPKAGRSSSKYGSYPSSYGQGEMTYIDPMEEIPYNPNQKEPKAGRGYSMHGSYPSSYGQGGSIYNPERTTKRYGGYGGYGSPVYDSGSQGYPWNNRWTTTEKVVSKQDLLAKCIRSCPVTGEYNPVCGSNDVTYTNLGRLMCEKACGVDVSLSRPTSCLVPLPPSSTTEKPKSREELVDCIRKCPLVDEFNPVCGSNNNTYVNLKQLECEQKCGTNVKLVKMSPCIDLEQPIVEESPSKEKQITDCIKNCPADGEYKPVCGSNKQTYMNIGRLQCAQNCGVDVQLSRPTSCDTPEEIVTSTTARPFVNLDSSNSGVIGNVDNTNGGEEVFSNGNDENDFNAGNLPGEVDQSQGNTEETEHSVGGNTDVNSNGYNEGIGENPADQNKNCGSTGHPKRPLSVKEMLECSQSCILSPEVNPVCGTDDITYANPGRLLCAQFCGIDVHVKKFGSCKSGNTDNLNCVTTCTNNQFTGNTGDSNIPVNTGSSTTENKPKNPENPVDSVKPGKPGTILPLSTGDCMDGCPKSNVYEPVCGTNNITYKNIEMLQCAAHCGINVSLLEEVECSALAIKPIQPVLPPVWSTTKKPSQSSGPDCISHCSRDPTYDPICGTDNITYNNTGHLICARECGVDVRTKLLSACEDDAPPMPPSPDQGVTHNNQNQNYNFPPGVLENIWGEKSATDDDEDYQLDQRFKDS